MGLRSVNWNDPRFQRMQQRAEASPRGNTIGLQNKMTRSFASNQMATKLGFAQLQEQKEAHKAGLDLQKRGFKHSKKMHKQQLQDARGDLKLNLMFGLGTAGLAGWLGKQQADREAKFGKLQQDVWGEQLKYYQKMNEGTVEERINRNGIPPQPTLAQRRLFR